MAHKGHEPANMTPAGMYGEEHRMTGKGKAMHRGRRRSARRRGKRV